MQRDYIGASGRRDIQQVVCVIASCMIHALSITCTVQSNRPLHLESTFKPLRRDLAFMSAVTANPFMCVGITHTLVWGLIHIIVWHRGCNIRHVIYSLANLLGRPTHQTWHVSIVGIVVVELKYSLSACDLKQFIILHLANGFSSGSRLPC